MGINKRYKELVFLGTVQINLFCSISLRCMLLLDATPSGYYLCVCRCLCVCLCLSVWKGEEDRQFVCMCLYGLTEIRHGKTQCQRNFSGWSCPDGNNIKRGDRPHLEKTGPCTPTHPLILILIGRTYTGFIFNDLNTLENSIKNIFLTSLGRNNNCFKKTNENMFRLYLYFCLLTATSSNPLTLNRISSLDGAWMFVNVWHYSYFVMCFTQHWRFTLIFTHTHSSVHLSWLRCLNLKLIKLKYKNFQTEFRKVTWTE